MFCTGIADEAGAELAAQIRAHRELGWATMEVRSIGGRPVAELDAGALDAAADAIADAGIAVLAVGSTLANWGRRVTDPLAATEREADATARAAARLGARFVRVMSYAVLPDRGADDQMADERARRLRLVVDRLRADGLVAVHENCMNYGGMGARFTLELLERVPGLRLVFDTGNPVFADDRESEPPAGKQSAWAFYERVRHAVDHVHIKDARWNAAAGAAEFTMPGEGDGDVRRIVEDLARRGYEGALSIEPHLSAVFHEAGAAKPDPEAQFRTYVEYGRRMEAIRAEAMAAAGRG